MGNIISSKVKTIEEPEKKTNNSASFFKQEKLDQWTHTNLAKIKAAQSTDEA